MVIVQQRKYILLINVLSYDKSHIDTKLDEILEFADLVGFSDSPMKFSSGMTSRLVFSTVVSFRLDI